MKKRLFSFVTAFFMLLGVIAPIKSKASMIPDTRHYTNVKLHKVLMDDEALKAHDESKKYDPVVGIDPLNTFFGQSAKPVEGAFFMAFKDKPEGQAQVSYEAEMEYMQGVIAGDEEYEGFFESPETIAEELMQMNNIESHGENLIVAGFTDENGELDLHLEDGKYIIYEFKILSRYNAEGGKELALSKAVPLAISLPFVNENGVQDTINVYPKNTESKSTVDKTIGDMTSKTDTYAIGQTHTWYLQANIGEAPKDYQVFGFTDDIDTKLDYKGNVKVYLVDSSNNKDGEDFAKETDYTIKEPTLDQAGGKLEIMLTKDGIAKLKEGYKLVASFDTAINNTAIMGQDITNNVTLTFGNNPFNPKNETITPPEETPPGENPNLPRVKVGGKTFVKQDSANPETKLKDAEFKIYGQIVEEIKTVNGEEKTIQKPVAKKGTGVIKYVKVGENGEITYVNKEQATVFKSGADGKFEVKGLPFTKDTRPFYLEEVKAPEDYVKALEPTEFDVNETSYYKAPASIKSADTKADADPLVINNTKQQIPPTGGIGTMVFTVVGLSLMSFAFFALRKNKTKA